MPIAPISPETPAAPRKNRKVMTGCAVGCGVLLLLFVIIGIVTAITGSKNSTGGGSTQSNIENMGNASNLFSGGGDVVTLEEYTKIQNGMSYAQVTEIIGDPGVEQSSSEMPAVPGVMAGISTKMYMWMNSGVPSGNMNAIFQNDKLIQKAQFGLK